MYCGNHRPIEETKSLSNRILKKARREGVEAIRVPCPIDSSHTVFKHDLEHHIKVCNAATKAAEMESQPYFCRDCNSGNNVDSHSAKAVDYDKLVVKIKQIYSDVVKESLEEPIFSSKYIPEKSISRAVGGDAQSFSRLRHVEQNVEIVRQMAEENLLFVKSDGDMQVSNSHDTSKVPELTHVELGAGAYGIVSVLGACG